MPDSPHLDPIYAAQIELIEKRFWLLFNNTAEFVSLVGQGLAFSGSRQNIENKLRLLQNMYFFSEEMLQALISGGESYSLVPISFIWERLVSANIMVKTTGHMPGVLADHQIAIATLLGHLRDQTFLNLFAPPSSLRQRYANAIVALDVELSDGQKSRGSGFIVRQNESFSEYLVTCKHNIDPQAGINLRAITTSADRRLSVTRTYISTSYDIAVLTLGEPLDDVAFRLSTNVDVFDEVFTLGFPMVPCAKPLLLGHRGEVNGIADLYMERCPALIISNLVSPGGSGGPVLSRHGHCVGMSFNWLEAEWGQQRTRFSAALPSELLAEAIKAAAHSYALPA